jgi:hypothetical protein
LHVQLKWLTHPTQLKFQAFVADTAVEALGVATVMSEDEEEKADEMKRKRYLRRLFMGGCCLLLLIIIPIAIVFSGGGDEDDIVIPLVPTSSPSAMPSGAPSPSPTSNAFADLLFVVAKEFNSAGMFSDAFGNQQTPQFRAAAWAANEGSLGLPVTDPRTLTRYALATFYFATEGDNWFRCGRDSTLCTDDQEWLTGPDECKWFAVKCGGPPQNRYVTELFFRKS